MSNQTVESNFHARPQMHSETDFFHFVLAHIVKGDVFYVLLTPYDAPDTYRQGYRYSFTLVASDIVKPTVVAISST